MLQTIYKNEYEQIRIFLLHVTKMIMTIDDILHVAMKKMTR